MAKTYIDTVKYIVHAYCEIDGLVEKPDVVGALFGQTEGLLGDELDLRELQKNGRIGRISVELSPKGGKSVGTIKLPSSLDMVETSILAAALESVDRVGPCEAKIKVEKIEDTRSLKRNQIVARAKELLKTILAEEIPESREISEQVRAEVKAAEISTYGPDKLPAGPNIDQKDSVILVEGRADVLNLLKNDITNVVAIGGANVSQTIIDLTKEKETIVFLDGDRGGDIILAELARVGDIDYVARAPAGKEVEELTRKEIIKCLRAKVPFEQRMVFLDSSSFSEKPKSTAETMNYQNNRYKSYQAQKQVSGPKKAYETIQPKQPSQAIELEPIEKQDVEDFAQDQLRDIEKSSLDQEPFTQDLEQQLPTQEDNEFKQKLLADLEQLEGSLKGKIYKNKNEVLAEIAVRDIIKTLESQQNVYAIVFDGLITKRLAELAAQKGAKFLAAIKLGNVFKKPDNLYIYTKE